MFSSSMFLKPLAYRTEISTIATFACKIICFVEHCAIEMSLLLTAKTVYIHIFYSLQSMSCFSEQNEKNGLTRSWLGLAVSNAITQDQHIYCKAASSL